MQTILFQNDAYGLDGSAAINNNVLRINKDGQVEETLLDTENKLREALHEHFSINISFPLKSTNM